MSFFESILLIYFFCLSFTEGKKRLISTEFEVLELSYRYLKF